jgi:activator of the mannose operon, transcriptional antiterminator
MNERQKELLHTLLIEQNEPIQVQELADRLNCSEKTIRNDFKQLEEELTDYPSLKIIRKPGLGVHLEVNQTERNKLYQLLLSRSLKSEDERTIEIAYQMLISNKPITLHQLAHQFYVTKSIIKQDLERISFWLERFGLEIVSKQRLGNMISGSELNKRSALAHLSDLLPSQTKSGKYVLDLFLPSEIYAVKKAITDMENKFSIFFTDGAKESLIVHALIMMKRTKQKSTINILPKEKEEVVQRQEFHYGKWFLNKLEEHFQISFPEDELIYFTWHLISAKRTGAESIALVENDTPVRKIVEQMIQKVSQLTLVNLNMDTVLQDGLKVHMHSVIHRLKYGLPITNPLLSNIKKMYPYMFSMVILALDDMEKTHQLKIPEDEAAYIVLHFQAAIERLMKIRNKEKRVLIVCHYGTGMSYLLAAKLEKYYKGMKIIHALGKKEVNEFLKEEAIDLIISTLPLEKVNIPYVVISPLLTAEDKGKLDAFFQEVDQKASSGAKSEMEDFLKDTFFFPQLGKSHRYEIVEIMGNKLVEANKVNPKFVHSLLLRERSSATAIGGGVAIPHAHPSYVYETTIAVANLKEPMEWGNELVSIVFLLAISEKDKSSLRSIMQLISEISNEPNMVEKLASTKDFSTFIKLLRK